MYEFCEQYGKFGEVRKYKLTGEKEQIIKESNRLKVYELWRILCTIFLPQGFPDSVSADYCTYQIWDTVQAFCSTISGIFATQQILKSVGVGDESISALSATIAWILKDGTGMCGRILFTWLKGHTLDNESKKWRLFADVANDLALLIEMLLQNVPKQYVIYVLCVSSVLKSIVGVVGGATRTAIVQHQAIRGNLADISAKDSSQETLVNLLASCTGLYLLTMLSDNLRFAGNLKPTFAESSNKLQWLIFALVTAIHLIANYKAVKSLHVPYLNSQRLLIVIDEFLKNKTIPNVEFVNQKENVFFGFGLNEKSFCNYNIEIGVSLTKLISSPLSSSKSISDKKSIVSKIIDRKQQSTTNANRYILIESVTKQTIYIVLKSSANSKTILSAYIEAILSTVIDRRQTKSERLQLSPQFIERFVNDLSAKHWCLERNLLIVDEWRFFDSKSN